MMMRASEPPMNPRRSFRTWSEFSLTTSSLPFLLDLAGRRDAPGWRTGQRAAQDLTADGVEIGDVRADKDGCIARGWGWIPNTRGRPNGNALPVAKVEQIDTQPDRVPLWREVAAGSLIVIGHATGGSMNLTLSHLTERRRSPRGSIRARDGPVWARTGEQVSRRGKIAALVVELDAPECKIVELRLLEGQGAFIEAVGARR
jgi:hypothetical protein